MEIKRKIGVTFIFVFFQNWTVITVKVVSVVFYGRLSFLNK